MLKWLEHPAESEEHNKFTFIDAFSRGVMMTEHQARQSVTHLVVHLDQLVSASPWATGQRMLRNLICIGARWSNSLVLTSATLCSGESTYCVLIG